VRGLVGVAVGVGAGGGIGVLHPEILNPLEVKEPLAVGIVVQPTDGHGRMIWIHGWLT
jgi:hypothetical protein